MHRMSFNGCAAGILVTWQGGGYAFLRVLLVAILATGWVDCAAQQSETDPAATTVESSPPTTEQPARITVDSCYSGYRAEVITDGKWWEDRRGNGGRGAADRLGNAGNTWVSAEGPGDHWVRLDWSEPVELDELTIWWGPIDWLPRAFRVEQLLGEQWVPVGDQGGWLSATARQCVIPLPSVRVSSLRILQPEPGNGSRALMGVQEISAGRRQDPKAALRGAQKLSARAYGRLTPQPLSRNIARLGAEWAGASAPVAWSADRRANRIPALADGNSEAVATALSAHAGIGVEWPIAHMIDGAALYFPAVPPDALSLVLEIRNDEAWIPLAFGLRHQVDLPRQRIEWSFAPVAARAVRFKLRERAGKIPVTELEVYRYLPSEKNIWPDRLIEKGCVKQELMARAAEPSFDSLAQYALPMQNARALLGLKDSVREVGVGWDGTIEGRHRLEFRVGADQYRLADARDVTRRELIDGWRPGVVIGSRLESLEFRETAFVIPAANCPSGVLVVSVGVRNLSKMPVSTCIEAGVLAAQGGQFEFNNGVLLCDGKVALVAPGFVAGSSTHMAKVKLDLPAGEERIALLLAPQDAVDLREMESCHLITLEQALAAFRAYWDSILTTAAAFEVPEARINHMVKAVLAQCFINGDGDVMPYGSAPSVYEGSLFGIEESYPMLALAMFGFGKDAQRYLEGTYLTAEFLKKAEQYHDAEDRHQQYRNGLQPHYAVSAFRIHRDVSWIRKHLPLIRQCAEWTISERRKTMVLENGQRPLHWGLLPKWAYGGDIARVECYALFGNLCCWRGLVDTAWLLGELGETAEAQRYTDEARDYRLAIERAIDGSYQRDQHPPFLPLRLYTDRPDEELDFYQLFAGCMLDVEAFAIGSRHALWITDYLQEDNRVFCLLPRFRPMGPGALDAIYGKGYFLTKLHEDSVREFLMGFYAYLAFNLDRDVFTSRESNLLYGSDLAARSSFRTAEISDPLPCASAVAIQMFRHMMVTEERADAGAYSGRIRLLAGAPRDWFADGESIRMQAAPTFFGPIDLEVHAHTRQGRIEAHLVPPKRNACSGLRLQLRHPEGKPIRSVTVNGKAHADFDAPKGWINLPADPMEALDVIAHY